MRTHEILFQPDGIKVKVETDCTLTEAAERAGIALNTFCGHQGTCKKCMVEIKGRSKKFLACQYHVTHNETVTIPESSRFFEQKILQDGISHEREVDPVVCKHFLELSEPTIEDIRSDARRLTDAVGGISGQLSHTCFDHEGNVEIKADLAILQSLPGLYRDHRFSVTAVCRSDGRIFALEPGDTTHQMYGVAVDVGTTTVVVSLMNLLNGKTVAVASQTNPQVSYGDDVIARIHFTTENKDGLGQLQQKIIDCINRLIAEACEKASVSSQQIYEMTLAGNATMQHLFLGIPVEQIAQAPYVGVVSDAVNVSAQRLGINIHPQGNVYVMPCVAAHVGGDTVAVALSAAMRASEGINLAVDIGTNGELVLGNRDRLVTCSTAAGPAFEGARIRQGMRGAPGAIERVHIDQDVTVSVIGDEKPIGLCGSGLMDAVAELLNVGLIDKTGRLLSGDEIPEGVSPRLRDRIIEFENASAFVLATVDETKHDEPILLTQKDIRETQLGKASICAGIMMLMKEMGVELGQIEQLYLAGAFGNYIRPESAIRIGLIPDVGLDKIFAIGNAASTGAKEVLLNREMRKHGEVLAREMDYVELASKMEFQEMFADGMFF